MKSLKDRVAIITGGTRGLGLGIAKAFIQAGAKVFVASRSAESVEKAVSVLKGMGGQVGGKVCDVRILEEVEILSLKAIEEFGKIDVWINNAGVSAPYGPTIQIPNEQILNLIQTNILGTYHGSLVAMRHFLKQRQGKLINVSGRGDKRPVPFQNAYGSSKSWMHSFTLTLAKEYKNSGIGVYLFRPGIVDTDMLRKVDVVEGYQNRIEPLKTVIRMWGNEPGVPAKKVVWLASQATDGKTGMVVSVFNRRRMVFGLLREVWGRILRHDTEQIEIEITPIEPEYE
jgi:NAD(P)-dependent dehydrogenase (short-subunit alcohol dehydrogenase family)